MQLLFVSNGHGEAAIADRIARDVRERSPQTRIDHLALVGVRTSESMNDVGPRRAMPSGGLIAMGNVRNIARDVGSGLLGLTASQVRFLRGVRGTYDAAVAVGDTFALMMALVAGSPAVFVGTAKSVDVAPYGRLEECVLRRARSVFVRDEPTAALLRAHGLRVEEPGNAIVDLYSGDERAPAAVEGFDPAVVLLPGSRENAYGDARFLLSLLRDVSADFPKAGAVLSIAPGLEAERFAREAAEDGWLVETGDGAIPFVLRDGARTRVRAWRGSLGGLFQDAALVLGQAGTANEAAAAAGVPVVAFERGRDRKTAWYRKRQRGLLQGALAILPGDVSAARGLCDLLRDGARRARMSSIGRERMGGPGTAARIAARILELAGNG